MEIPTPNVEATEQDVANYLITQPGYEGLLPISMFNIARQMAIVGLLTMVRDEPNSLIIIAKLNLAS